MKFLPLLCLGFWINAATGSLLLVVDATTTDQPRLRGQDGVHRDVGRQPAAAHHSGAASYEANQSLEISGRVVAFAWRNPHCHLYVTATEGRFKGQVYTVELGSPEALLETGWTMGLVRPGDRIAIDVHPSRAGAPIGLCRNCVVTINGKTMFTSDR